MNPYVKLTLVAIVPLIVSVILYIADNKTPFGKIKYPIKQTVFGIVFGLVSIMGTEFGVNMLGATLNVRDVAPICAGLIFGAPAGIISGVIGGVERYFAAYWGAGEYTQIACSVATVFAGCFSAFLRKVLFEDKKPSFYYGMAAAVITEVIHMLMVFLTKMSDAKNAFIVVQKCTLPMCIITGISVAVTLIVISFVSREKLFVSSDEMHISQKFQKKLLVCILIAFVCTSLFTYIIQTGISQNDIKNLLSLNVEDVKTDITEASDDNLRNITVSIAKDIDKVEITSKDELVRICNAFDVSEINIVDRTGIITNSTNDDYIGFDMQSGEQSKEFMRLAKTVHGSATYVQEYRETTYDRENKMKYAGAKLSGGGYVQVGYNAERFQNDIDYRVRESVHNRHIGEYGYLIVCDEAFRVIAKSSGVELDTSANIEVKEDIKPMEMFEYPINNTPSYCMYSANEGYYIVAVAPREQILFTRDFFIYITVFLEIIVFATLFILIYVLIKTLILKNLEKINGSLSQITAGDLSVTVDVRSNKEFADLSDDINSTVTTLRKYIDEAAARIDKELEFAKTIQHSALPSVFPPYPSRKEFDIWANMFTAKEVGGDFYDFYLTGDDKLAFLIADVSGKGIPAAMFMMTAKTLIKSLTESGKDAEEVFTVANSKLCESNEAGMFVTAWLGIIDLKTGVLSYANAGHNPPVIKHKDGRFEYLKSRAGFVLAGMDGINYKRNELTLGEGDMIFLYTDGVTEATDLNNNLYGEDRLLDRLNGIGDGADMKQICEAVKEDVDLFVGEAMQFDDITMLAFKYEKATEVDDK